MKHWKTHPIYVEGCFACRIGTVGFASVPGGTRAGSVRLWHERQIKKNLEKYKGARDNGLRPEGTTVAAVEKAERLAESYDRGARKLGFKDDPALREAIASG